MGWLFGFKFIASIQTQYINSLLENHISEKTTVNTQIGSSNSIKFVSSENSTETIVSNQIGQKNIFSSQNLVQRAPKTFICNQKGSECRIAITLDDQTRGRVNLDIEGRGGRFTKYMYFFTHVYEATCNKLSLHFILNRAQAYLAQLTALFRGNCRQGC